MTLESLVDLWCEIEPELFGFVEGLLRRYGRGIDMADDILQMTFVKILGQDRLEEIDQRQFRQLVFWMVKRVYLDWIRKEGANDRARRNLQDLQDANGLHEPLQTVHEVEVRELLACALAEVSLTELEAKAVLAFLEAGGSRKGAIAALELTDDEAVQNRYDQPKHRAFVKLRRVGLCWASLDMFEYDRCVEMLIDLLKTDFRIQEPESGGRHSEA